MAKTKKPTGLTIKRSGQKFTCSWKIADADYGDGQSFQKLINKTGDDKWQSETIGVGTTSRAVTIDKSKYYPNTKNYLYDIRFRVNGNRKKYTTGSGKNKKAVDPSVSDWSTAVFTLSLPIIPNISSVELDGTQSNRCHFYWSVNVGNTDTAIYTNMEWQSILVKDSNETDGSKLPWKTDNVGWKTGTSSAYSGDINGNGILEDSSILATGSFTRWVRLRSRGPKGVSNWRYAKHVYAVPFQALIDSTSFVKKANGYQCTVNWTAVTNASHPVDNTTVQYAIAQPAANMSCPSNPGWSDAKVFGDTSGQDSAVFFVDTTLNVDQCIFVRVNTRHDLNVHPGDPEMVVAGYLADPINLSISDIVPSTHRAKISATNQSQVEDSVLAVVYNPSDGTPFVCGIIEHGEPSVTVQVPDWGEGSPSFSVYAMVGTYEVQTRLDGVSVYTVNIAMRSEATLKAGGEVPAAPSNVTVARVGVGGTIQVTWDWSWKQADRAELSWADHDDAWESTDQPETYILTNVHASKWNITGLDIGKTWYVRVRLILGADENNPTYGPYSDIVPIQLLSAPDIPVLRLSRTVVPEQESTTASWVYVSTDGTPQSYAELALVVDGQNPEENIIAHALTSQHLTLDVADIGFTSGNTYTLVLRVKSQSGLLSEWSEPVSITIAEPLSCSISQTSLDTVNRLSITNNPEGDVSITEELALADYLSARFSGQNLSVSVQSQQSPGEVTFRGIVGESTSVVVVNSEDYGIIWDFAKLESNYDMDWLLYEEHILTDMPLTITATGAGIGGRTLIVIERAAPYHMDRPDEKGFDGYDGETIAQYIQIGEEQITIEPSMLIGRLDDGATYKIVATVQDSLGQSDSDSVEFIVGWEQQAVSPSAVIEIDEEQMIAKITPVAVEGIVATDVCDIYRLSVDRPELIVEGAEFGETYVDPYPTLGEMGGYRLVTRTANGDYTTKDNGIAWVNSPELGVNPISNEDSLNIIDFEDGQIRFYYDSDFSSTWDKDFQETHYLGGSVQGDWNPAVSRTGTISTLAITELDQDMIQMVRRLATYTGICHVRTSDGSSYAANVEVAEDRSHSDRDMLVSYSLNVTRIDTEGFDGMTLAQWNHEHPVDVVQEES